jgi:hypothetical protein
LIVPGKRVGPVTAVSTEADLRAAFGAAAVKRSQIRIDSQTTAPGLEIYAGKPGESLAVAWPRTEGEFRWPLLLMPCYGQANADCRWRTPEGVRVGAGMTELEKLNGKPFLLYPNAPSWTNAWWNDGKLATSLGEDVELQFPMPVRPDPTDEGYVASDAAPLSGSALRVSRMLVWLLSIGARVQPSDWTIDGPFFSAIGINKAELLRESLGPDAVHRTIGQGEEGIGTFPEISLFEGTPDRSIVTAQHGPVICGGMDGYRECRWRLREPFALIMTVGRLQELNGRPFIFNGMDWDYGGFITSWDGGKLEKVWPNAGAYFISCKGDVPERMVGDGHPLRSDDPDLRKLDCSAFYR